MNWPTELSTKLQTSGEAFEWAFWQVPEQHRAAQPIDPNTFGLWPAVRHIWHVTEYERCIALPSMRIWLGGPPLAEDAWPDDDATWQAQPLIAHEVLFERFWQVRRQEIDLIRALQDADWNACRDTGWGRKPLSWVVTKTYQHTLEHTDTLLRMRLWWDHILELIAAATH